MCYLKKFIIFLKNFLLWLSIILFNSAFFVPLLLTISFLPTFNISFLSLDNPSKVKINLKEKADVSVKRPSFSTGKIISHVVLKYLFTYNSCKN